MYISKLLYFGFDSKGLGENLQWSTFTSTANVHHFLGTKENKTESKNSVLATGISDNNQHFQPPPCRTHEASSSLGLSRT